MKTSFFTGLILASALLLGCGKSLSDAEKKSAGEAVSALSSESITTSRAMRAAAQEVFEKAHRTGCTPNSGSTAHGFTFSLTCPDSNTYRIVLTSTAEIDRTCGSDTVKITNLNATFTYSFTSSTYSISGDIGADVNSETLSCQFAASIDGSTGTSTVSGNGFTCTYNGATLSASDLQTNVCST